MNFRRLSYAARTLVEKRGGTEGLKRDASELSRIAKGPGTVKDKARSAASALQSSGAEGTGGREPTSTPGGRSDRPPAG